MSKDLLRSLGVDPDDYDAYAARRSSEPGACSSNLILPLTPAGGGAIQPGESIAAALPSSVYVPCQMRTPHTKHVAFYKGDRYEWE